VCALFRLETQNYQQIAGVSYCSLLYSTTANICRLPPGIDSLWQKKPLQRKTARDLSSFRQNYTTTQGTKRPVVSFPPGPWNPPSAAGATRVTVGKRDNETASGLGHLSRLLPRPPPPHPSASRTPQSSVSASFPLRYRPGVPLPSPLLWFPAAPLLLHPGSSSPSSLPVSRRCSFETTTERFE